MQCTVLQCSPVQYTLLHCTTVQSPILQFPTAQYTIRGGAKADMPLVEYFRGDINRNHSTLTWAPEKRERRNMQLLTFS